MTSYSIDQLKLSAQRTADKYAMIANQRLGCKLSIPVNLSFDLQDTSPKAAGSASVHMELKINMILFEDNVKHVLNETISHEMAHLIQFHKFDNVGAITQGHGIEWREIMKKLGKTPTKFHNLDVTRSVAHFKSVKKASKKKSPKRK